MDTGVERKLADLAETLRDLPEEAQADVLDELKFRVDSLRTSRMTDAQRSELKERLATPREFISSADVDTLLRRFNPNL